ncbi:hypothetical protein PR202_gb01170 [Eleusine coracana subsp. coracana]|uniref:Uncharacterized protein n=1 Tax=Eleusine coracana subsp. coracana TaxID=191504 RepID=A0AAV5DW50_ELECO|nr:hypothetical protein PR202_gb01170 [Eleusine coracana subsp. coracana]
MRDEELGGSTASGEREHRHSGAIGRCYHGRDPPRWGWDAHQQSEVRMLWRACVRGGDGDECGGMGMLPGEAREREKNRGEEKRQGEEEWSQHDDKVMVIS